MSRIDLVGIDKISEPKEYICQHCQDGLLYLTLSQMNKHIRFKHSMEIELTTETAVRFERLIEPDADD